jgi:hypothetical protein
MGTGIFKCYLEELQKMDTAYSTIGGEEECI